MNIFERAEARGVSWQDQAYYEGRSAEQIADAAELLECAEALAQQVEYSNDILSEEEDEAYTRQLSEIHSEIDLLLG